VTDTLYYEKLDISILELENKLSKTVYFLNAHRQEEVRAAPSHCARARETDKACSCACVCVCMCVGRVMRVYWGWTCSSVSLSDGSMGRGCVRASACRR
jgi:hypothetical protein